MFKVQPHEIARRELPHAGQVGHILKGEDMSSEGHWLVPGKTHWRLGIMNCQTSILKGNDMSSEGHWLVPGKTRW